MDAPADPAAAPRLRIAFAAGTSPGKWFRRWRERTGGELVELPADDPAARLAAGEADMALARDPGADPGLHRIRLYREAPGVAAGREHPIALLGADEPVAEADLAGETLLADTADPALLRRMLPAAAAGAGVVRAPRPLLRALGGRGVVERPLAEAGGGPDDADAAGRAEPPGTWIWLIWPRELDGPAAQEFAGVVRGRRAGSSRGTGARREDAAPARAGRGGRGAGAGRAGRGGRGSGAGAGSGRGRGKSGGPRAGRRRRRR